MLDINLIREKPEYVKEALKKKLWETDFTELLSWDKEKRELLKIVEPPRPRSWWETALSCLIS